MTHNSSHITLTLTHNHFSTSVSCNSTCDFVSSCNCYSAGVNVSVRVKVRGVTVTVGRIPSTYCCVVALVLHKRGIDVYCRILFSILLLLWCIRCNCLHWIYWILSFLLQFSLRGVLLPRANRIDGGLWICPCTRFHESTSSYLRRVLSFKTEETYIFWAYYRHRIT